MNRIVFFEDEQAECFSPIALFRPVFELMCGHFSVRERILRHFDCENERDSEAIQPQLKKEAETADDAGRMGLRWGAILRQSLTEIYQEEHPESCLNSSVEYGSGMTLVVNARWLTVGKGLDPIQAGTAGWIDDELAWVVVEPGDLIEFSQPEQIESLRCLAKQKRKVEATGRLVRYPWDLISQNAEQISLDFFGRETSNGQSLTSNPGVVGEPTSIFVHATAQLDPYVVIDATHGPVYIDEGAKIQAFTRIEGPAYIGRQSQTFRANIREGTTIGPVCRVGGEIEESIIHGFANKYHDGFLGHSYICPWVNLGALTSNSDLKNDYSNVSVPLVGKGIQSHSNKVGCFIGDHTKTALCSLFNTGSSIGAMSLILPGGELLPKHIPPFSRIWHGKLEELPDGTASALQTAEYAMGRREKTLTPAMRNYIQSLFEQTQAERESALARYHK